MGDIILVMTPLVAPHCENTIRWRAPPYLLAHVLYKTIFLGIEHLK